MYPKISIVTVSYNQVEFIEDNIRSVINQNYPNIEHIIIDAGSTDGTIEILKKYDKYINWISEPDNGQSDGLNKGFKKATGDIIGWINSDDKLAESALDRVVKFFQRNPDEIAVVGDIQLISEKGKKVRVIKGKSYEYKKMLEVERGVTQPSTFFKQLVFKKIGYINTSYHYAMDFDFFLRMSSIKSIPHIDKTLAEFRLQPNAKTTNGLKDFRKEHLKIALNSGAFIFSKGIQSDIYVILTDPLRNISWIRNKIRSIKGLPPYSEERFN